MLKLLVVDDNALIRQSVIERIACAPMKLRCVGEAEDGRQAFRLIEQLRPDIVITDIKMPIADGFHTIEQCAQAHPEIQFIIISGYDDFQYVKRAVQLQVVNYILKPIDTEELYETIAKAGRQVEAYRNHQAERQQTNLVRQSYRQQQLDAAFLEYFTGRIDYLECTERLRRAEFPFGGPYAACLCVNACAPHGDVAEKPSAEPLRALAEQMEQAYLGCSCHVFHLYKGVYIAVLLLERATALSARVLGAMQERAQAALCGGAKSRVCLSASAVWETSKLRKAYSQCLHQMAYRFLPDYAQCTVIPPEIKQIQPNPAFCACFQTDLEVALSLDMIEECKKIVLRALQRAALDAADLLACVPQMFAMLWTKMGQRPYPQEGDASFRFAALLRFYDLAQIQQTLFRLLDSLPKSEDTQDAGDKAIAYLNHHFTEQISLRELAGLFHLNQIYLGQLIKKKTGLLFNAYLTKLRLNKAMELIQADPSLLLKDLSYCVGVLDAHYFTKVFKKHVGRTPTEYRDAILSAKRR